MWSVKYSWNYICYEDKSWILSLSLEGLTSTAKYLRTWHSPQWPVQSSASYVSRSCCCCCSWNSFTTYLESCEWVLYVKIAILPRLHVAVGFRYSQHLITLNLVPILFAYRRKHILGKKKKKAKDNMQKNILYLILFRFLLIHYRTHCYKYNIDSKKGITSQLNGSYISFQSTRTSCRQPRRDDREDSCVHQSRVASYQVWM